MMPFFLGNLWSVDFRNDFVDRTVVSKGVVIARRRADRNGLRITSKASCSGCSELDNSLGLAKG